MEITVSRDDIYAGLLKSQSILEKRSTMPILSNVLLEARSDSIRIRATDLDIGIETSYPANVVKEGSLTVPGKKLFEMVREMEEGELRLKKKDDNHIEIRSGKAVFNIVGLPSEEFPSFPSYESQVFFKLPAAVVSRMIEKTIYAVSTDEIRYTLNGIFLEKEDGQLKMVATDGHRLSLINHKDPSLKGVDISKGVIIPRKGAGELRRILEDGAEELMVSIKDNSGVFKTGNTTIVMRMIEGEFADYRQVLPSTKSEKEGRVGRETLLRVLRRVSTLSSEKSRGVKLSFSKGQLEVSTANPDIGEASETIDADFSGDGVAIGFNSRYLMDTLNSIDEEEIRIEIRGELGPVLVRGVDGEDSLSIIMPMRL